MCRAPAHVVNAFTVETTIDELAARARRSPVDLRLEILVESDDVPKEPSNPSNGRQRVTIHKVVSVGDVGQLVNVSTLEAQMEGAIIDRFGAAFYGEVPIERGRATSGSFGDYRLIRMREAPLAIETHFIKSSHRPTGFGEPPLPPIAPAVANAIAAVTDERIRVMPFVRAGYTLSPP